MKDSTKFDFLKSKRSRDSDEKELEKEKKPEVNILLFIKRHFSYLIF
jgi:hypothetical protein